MPSRCCCSSTSAARWTSTCASASSCSQRRAASSSICEHFYFHNFPYENLWTDNSRRAAALTPTERVLRTYGRDYRVIVVGDATMSPYEITQPGGSIEHWNREAGALWMQRLCAAFPRLVWLNPLEPSRWPYSPSVRIAARAGRPADVSPHHRGTRSRHP